MHKAILSFCVFILCHGGDTITKKVKVKLKEPHKQDGLPTPEITEKETATNALPVKSREYFHIRDSGLIVAMGGLTIKNDSHKPEFWVDFSDEDIYAIAKSKNMEFATLFIGRSEVKYVESFFRNRLNERDDWLERNGFEVEPFSPNRLILEKGESPFRRSAHENGIRYVKPIIEKIRSLPDDCGNEYENYLMQWFKFWSEKSVEKYGDNACIQFQDFPEEE
jgi:hypothetical protein